MCVLGPGAVHHSSQVFSVIVPHEEQKKKKSEYLCYGVLSRIFIQLVCAL